MLFTKTELAEELGDELIWSSIPCDFSEDFPGAGEVDLKQVDRHTEGQAFVDRLQAFNSFLDEGDVTSIRKISRILLNQPSIFEEEGVDPVFNLIDVLIFQNGNLDMIFRQLVDFDLLWKVNLVEEDDAVAILRDLKELAILIGQGFASIEDQEDQISFLEGFFERSTPICSTMSSVSRIPAVSTSLRGTPLMLTYSSMTSRVVPSISVTMAFSSRRRLLRS